MLDCQHLVCYNISMKDTLGRENRKIADRRCNECGRVYRPKRGSSKYCSYPCMWKNAGKHQGQSKDHEIWWLNNRGYIEGRVWRNGKCFRIKQARWVMEQHLGRPLTRKEIPHHKNEIKTDNRIENLELKEYGKHSSDHNKGRIHKCGYKVRLTEAERKRRSDWMKSVHMMHHLKFLEKQRIKYRERKENERVSELQTTGSNQ